MSWKQIKAGILERHRHAVEHDETEVRLVLGYNDGARVSLVVREHANAAVIVAQIARGSASQIVAMLRAASSLGVPITMIGDSVCVRVPVANDNVETTLQSVARAALRVRSASTPPRTDLGAFAFAL
ncbi:MAG: hypothetical protein AB7T06_02805 [Kofleriaceae bacterium]